jgi:surfeit locus 1 family protein
MMSAWQFKPGLIPTISVIVLFPALIYLGFWQLDRAGQKMALYVQYLKNQKLEPAVLNDMSPDDLSLEQIKWRHVLVNGRYDFAMHYLLDNQVVNGKAGYVVYTPFRIGQGEIFVLVNRGWAPAGTNRGQPPSFQTPEDIISLEGVIKEVPNTGILLSDDIYEYLENGVVRVQKIDLDDISRRSMKTFLPFILRLNYSPDSGFVRRWLEPGSDRKKNLGYAYQWFLLSAVLLGIYIIVNLKRVQAEND